MISCVSAVPEIHPKPRVLIIDDCALSNRVMTLVLRSRGFPCIAVTSEATALVTMEEFRPDVVILEWASRLRRETERARRLRALAERQGRTIAVIVVTHESAIPSDEVLHDVNGYFTKPVMLESLEQAIETLASSLRRARAG